MRFRERLIALTLLSLAVFAGCAQFKAIVSTPPAPTPAVPAEAAPPALSAPIPPAPAKAATPAPSTPTPSAPTKAPPVAPPVPTPSVPAQAAPSKLAPQLSQAEQERLRRDATTRIDATERIVRQIADRRLGADQQETLATIQSFVDKARQALATQDLQPAFTLADKAEALAQDLLRTTR